MDDNAFMNSDELKKMKEIIDTTVMNDAKEGITSLADLIWIMYSAFIEKGASPDEAIKLTQIMLLPIISRN